MHDFAWPKPSERRARRRRRGSEVVAQAQPHRAEPADAKIAPGHAVAESSLGAANGEHCGDCTARLRGAKWKSNVDAEPGPHKPDGRRRMASSLACASGLAANSRSVNTTPR